MSEEIFEVPGFSNFFVNKSGHVFKRLKISEENRYRQLFKKAPSGKIVSKMLHRAVMEIFVGPCPEGMVVNHKNGNKADASLENLEYVTQKENVRHSINVLGNFPAVSKRYWTPPDVVRKVRNARAQGLSYEQIAADCKVSPLTVYKICAGKSRKNC